MTALTTEHPFVHQPNHVRSPGSDDLIRIVGSVQAPAAGPWEIGSGQRLGLAARGWRSRTLSARILNGTLTVTDDVVGSSLDFTLLVLDSGSCVDVSATVTRLLSVDSWQAEGTTATTIGARPVSIRLRYNGVFRQRGRQPSLWITVEAAVDLPELGAALGRRRACRLELAAELNLNPRSDRDGFGNQS